MAKRRASDIERLFSPCSAIGFLASDDHPGKPAAIVLGFDDQVSGSVAYHALKEWAKDDELIITLCNRKVYIDASFIHTRTQEIAIISQLSFSEKEFTDFVNHEPQDRLLTIDHRINSVKNNRAVKPGESTPLILIRYILVVPDDIAS